MIKEFAGDPYSVDSDRNIRQVIDYLSNKITGRILDVGQRSPLTDAIEGKFSKVDNTIGDLDIEVTAPEYRYDTIIYSHTIEHQFNPLFTLLELKQLMHFYTRLIIILPSRTKILWTPGHYHEIDHYRMQLLIKRAGLRIVSYERRKHWRKWYTYFFGLRPFMRLFLEYNAYYMIQL